MDYRHYIIIGMLLLPFSVAIEAEYSTDNATWNNFTIFQDNTAIVPYLDQDTPYYLRFRDAPSDDWTYETQRTEEAIPVAFTDFIGLGLILTLCLFVYFAIWKKTKIWGSTAFFLVSLLTLILVENMPDYEAVAIVLILFAFANIPYQIATIAKRKRNPYGS